MVVAPYQLKWFALLGAVLWLAGCASQQRNAAAPKRADGIFYTDTGGSERAVVFIHGWASTHEVWVHQVDNFAKQHDWRLIAIDLPGHGESELPGAPLTMDLFADAIAEVMNDAAVEQAVLVGHSNGTPVIRQFERRYPSRTLALVTVDGSLRPVLPPDQMGQFATMFESDDYEADALRMVDQMLPEDWSAAESELIRRMVTSTPQKSMVEGIRAAADPAIWKDDPIEVPVLMVNADSEFWTDEYLSEVRTIAPDLEVHTLEGVSHFLMIDDPKRFNRLVTEFVQRKGLLD